MKGKTPTSELTEAQLRRRKIEAVRLSLSFVFAVKHYLRGEDGMYWEDYAGVLPPSFARFDETGYNTQKTASTGSYAAVRNHSTAPSPDSSASNSPDATKRIRVKRSKTNLVPAKISDPHTPLLSNTHRSVEFHPFADQASIPLPLMFVFSYRYYCHESYHNYSAGLLTNFRG